MAKGISAKRHAQAVFGIAQERNELEKWHADLKVMADVLRDPDLVAFLENPKNRLAEKMQLLQNVLYGINPLAMNLAYLLVARNRLHIVNDLTAEYERLVDAHQGREHALATTAISLDSEDVRKLGDRLSDFMHKEIVLSVETDPQIMGGLVVRVGDKLIDGSVRTRIQELKESLLGQGRLYR